MTRAVFETATIADSVKKAARVAPARGQAFDKAAGIILDVSPSVTVIKATNLEVFYTEWVDSISVEGDRSIWRLPAQLLASVLGSLPIGTGKTVTFELKDKVLHLTAGRTKARFNLISPEYFPIWAAFDPDNLTEASDLGGRLEQVSWAATNTLALAPLCGVHLDGQYATATDRYRLASVPLPIPGLIKPVTVPGDVLAGLLKKTGEVHLTVEEQQLLVMPDEHSQVRVVCFGQEYPPIKSILDKVAKNKDSVTLKKTALIEMVSRAQNFAGSDRSPMLRMFFGQEEIAVMMQNAEVGLLGDVVDVSGQALHKRVEYRFTPKNVLDALGNAPNEEITLGYDSTKSTILYINGGSGYEACIAPRAGSNSGEQ